MDLSEFVLYLLAGRLWVWLLRTNGLTRDVWKIHPRLQELSECDLCLGFWVYLAMKRKPTLAAATALLGHLLAIGWRARFQTTVID